jgi:hypothetical protein
LIDQLLSNGRKHNNQYGGGSFNSGYGRGGSSKWGPAALRTGSGGTDDVSNGYEDPEWAANMGGRLNNVLLDQWPPGSVAHNTHTWFARRGDMTGCGTPQDCLASIMGASLTYVVNVWWVCASR